MVKYQGEFETKNNKICFSFLQNDDFIRTSAFQQETKSVALENIIKIKSKKSGIPLDFRFLEEIVISLQDQIIIESKKNSLLTIKNNSFTCYFYTLTKFLDQPNVVLLYFWEISLFPIISSREKWTCTRQLGLRDCCLTNYFLELGKNPKISPPLNSRKDVDQYCHFPGKFIEVNCKYSVNLLESCSPEIQTQFNKLDLFIKNSIAISDKYQPILYSTNLLYPTLFLELHGNSGNLPNFIKKTLHDLKYDSLYNVNCQDLFCSISITDASFKQFLYNALFTILEKQTAIFLENKKKPNFKNKLLLAEFLF